MSQQTSLSLRELLAWVQVGTVGDLWKALQEGKSPAVAITSAISLGPPYGRNTPQPKFPKPADQLEWDVLDRALALCDAEGGDRAEAMRKLIARVALATKVERREIVNMPLARFVEAAGGKGDDYFMVTLTRAAGVVSKSKRTLEGWVKNDPDFPLPDVEGGGGRANEWKWSRLRPYLEKKVGRMLPERFPSDTLRPDFGSVEP